MIAISSPLFDTEGHLVIRELPSTDLGETRRRMNRIATLDGGAVVNDSGYSPSDLTLVIRWRATRQERDKAERMVQLYPALTVATRKGVFDAAVQSLTDRGGETEITLLVKGMKQ